MQNWYGGGEVYTSFFSRALEALGVPSVLFAHPEARHWQDALPSGTKVVALPPETLRTHFASLRNAQVVFHSVADPATVGVLHGAGSSATAIAHMPWYERDPAALAPYDLIVPVSRHVADSIRACGLQRMYPEPLYGIADLRGARGDSTRPLYRGNRYDWDRRKMRDRVLSWLQPLARHLRPPVRFARRPGITLGIVSGLTPIKQFPLLFQHLAPVLARFPAFRLEVFGSGGYASVRDLRRAVAPLADRARFWGRQREVAGAYAQIDYLLAGLPEKEALGLNVLEAQACGVPVLAVDAPPFTETVASEVTGLLYADPRADGGAGFANLLERLAQRPFRFDEERAKAHLEPFSEPAFIERVARLVAALPR
jgi:glycosyltransferase involved in cell wall biosynthesis